MDGSASLLEIQARRDKLAALRVGLLEFYRQMNVADDTADPVNSTDAAGPPQNDSDHDSNYSRSSKRTKATHNEDDLPESNMFIPAGPSDEERERALRLLIDKAQDHAQKDDYLEDIEYLRQCLVKLGPDMTRPSKKKKGYWHIKGLKEPLRPFQIVGIMFMRNIERENDEQKRSHTNNKPAGGMLADEMGLGKTAQMLANIMADRVESIEQGVEPRTTLIVATRGILAQWQGEIERFCQKYAVSEFGYRLVKEFLPGNRYEESDAVEHLSKTDFLLTSYDEVRRSYSGFAVYPRGLSQEEKMKWWQANYDKFKGVLHQINFRRVVLDEADAIKNHESLTSRSCRALVADHHWAVSGTPLMNRLPELYPYFKFIRVPHTGSFEDFKDKFTQHDDPDGNDNLKLVLKEIMCRRLHRHHFLGERLLKLWRSAERTVILTLNEIEMHIYNIFLERFVADCNEESKSRTFFVLLLHLRRICDNPILLLDQMHTILQVPDIMKLESLNKAGSEDGRRTLAALKKLLERKKKANAQTGTDSDDDSIASDDVCLRMDDEDADGDAGLAQSWSATGGAHGKSQDIVMYLTAVLQKDDFADTIRAITCSYCTNIATEAQCMQCTHVLCLCCVRVLQSQAAGMGHEHANCPKCKEAIIHYQSIEEMSAFQKLKTKAKSKGKKGKKNGNGSKQKAKDCPLSFLDVEGPLYPSSKTMAIKQQVRIWLEAKKKHKILIYTQWYAMMQVISSMLRSEHINHLLYHGKQSHAQRRKVLDRFRDETDMQVLIISLTCGGMGLNLTMASRILMTDPYWNHAVEEQAAARVNRIGQKHATQVVHLEVGETIDSAMRQMQDFKSEDLKRAMELARLKKWEESDGVLKARDALAPRLLEALMAQRETRAAAASVAAVVDEENAIAGEKAAGAGQEDAASTSQKPALWQRDGFGQIDTE